MVEVRLVGMYAGVVIGVAGESFGFFLLGNLLVSTLGPQAQKQQRQGHHSLFGESLGPTHTYNLC